MTGIREGFRIPEDIFGRDTPWKINMEPKDHLFEKENHLQNLHVWLQNVTVTVIFQAVCECYL